MGRSSEASGIQNSTPPLWFGPLLVTLALVVGLVVAELSMRVAWDNPFKDEPSDHLLQLRLHHANRRLGVDRSEIDPGQPTVSFRTDERGYILPSRRFPEPDLTIAFLGGSTTECAAVDEELRFPALTSTLLEERGLRVNILNAARSGNTTHDSINVLFNHVLEDRPDVVVMMHAANDIGMLSAAGSYRSRMAHELTVVSFGRWFLQETSSRSWLAGALRKWLTVGHGPVQGFDKRMAAKRERDTVDTEPFARRLRSFVRVARAFGAEPVLATQPSITMVTPLTPDWINPHNQEVFNRIVRDVAHEENAGLLDLVDHLVREVPGWDEPGQIFYDGVHVTNHGSRVYAEYIADVLWEEVIPRIRMPARRSASGR